MSESYASYHRTDGFLACSVRPQKRFRVLMRGDYGDVTITLEAGSIDSVIDQVANRRIATPPGMQGIFLVSEAD